MREILARTRRAVHVPAMRDFPEPRFVDAGGVRLATYEAGEGPAAILLHGWPELAYSWKNQIPALAGAGWRAVAVDLKGFGLSDAPPEKELYDCERMSADFAALLDALGLEKAVFIGHDWGGALVWSMAQLRPERVAGVVSVCTPAYPRAPAPPLDIIAERLTPDHYFIRFQPEGFAEALFESDVERFFAFVFRKPVPREVWPRLIPHVFDLPARFAEGGRAEPEALVMGPEDLRVYVEAYARTGFRGGINLYRNINRNWALMEGRDETVRAPALWIGAELDLFLPPEAAQGMERIVPDLEKHVLSGCGHWVMWEKPAELNALLLDWLERRVR
ncbi:epoxide hydrolase/non-specific protein-tyrosine kinase [Amphiplicatus metriothermophilus]|uniref:Epoxide hydrolase/non-specific protein-tyrosine kinase n=2 Tax=Amphiplicatus metriothermophilus TaxID=1519374 RepID=A0A239PKY3_9PROT|nr:alpha/beta hydrolase [Amphiplicatus metriothermophilus]MBB5517378.1 microsomal epoxide hydrolase/non-specific protein-tyrosine kinase [Amphiplicatus metriothermophilus]SNT68287.1 epoxide hydrolase/non-specific protein-tyrosine kinase [Amphiplicatus metriothermophilus]